MGAQVSLESKGKSGAVQRQLSDEAAAWSRVAELEADLEQKEREFQRQETELSETQRLLVKLTDDAEKQSELEHDRIERVEATVAQQLPGLEAKVGKLLLAVATEKQRAEAAERAREEAVERAEAERAAAQELRSKLAEEAILRRAAEEQARLLLKAQGGWDAAASSGGCSPVQRQRSIVAVEMVGDLQQQLSEEVSRRMGIQTRLLHSEKQLREANEKLARMSPEAVVGGEGVRLDEASCPPAQAPAGATDEQARLAELEGKLQEKELQLKQLQQQLDEERDRRPRALEQLAERDRDQLGSVISKEREVCELQRQLADELSRRQSVQFQLLQKERLIRKLSVASQPDILACHQDALEREEEPDKELSPDQPTPPISPLMRSRTASPHTRSRRISLGIAEPLQAALPKWAQPAQMPPTAQMVLPPRSMSAMSAIPRGAEAAANVPRAPAPWQAGQPSSRTPPGMVLVRPQHSGSAVGPSARKAATPCGAPSRNMSPNTPASAQAPGGQIARRSSRHSQQGWATRCPADFMATASPATELLVRASVPEQ